MKRSLILSLVVAIAAFPLLVSAQSVATEAVGFTTNTVLGNSDTHISPPFVRPPAFVGGIQSASGNTITVSGSPFTPNQFVYNGSSQRNHYYALVGAAPSANPKEGHTYPIVGNGANTLTVQLSQDDLVGIPANAQVTVIPNWTLATLFPPSDQNVSFTPTTSSASYKTQIRVPDPSAAGINPPHTSYFFSNNVDGTSGNVGWRLVGDNTTDRGDDPLLPDSYFVVRNLNGAPTLPLVTLGSVLTQKVTVPLMTSTSSQQDNPVSLLRPLDVPLNATGLNRNDGSFTPNDRLLLFNNAVAGYDKQASVYYVDASAPNGPWRLQNDGTFSDRGGDVIPSGTGFIVRKAQTATGQPAFWTNSFPVQAVKAVSRKTHGSAGTFDIELPLSGTPAVENRQPSSTHKVVFTFPAPVTVSGATVTSGTATTSAPMLSNGGTEVAVDMTGVANAQRVTVTLLGVSDGANTNDVAVRMGLLLGDTNGSGGVNASDIGQTKAASGQAVSSTNFRQDVNLSGGSINASDIGLVKANSGTSLPPNVTMGAAEIAAADEVAERE
jgi:uncharacterized protein (TIGR02597 family)